MPKVIEVDGLVKEYGAVTAVDRIRFSVDEGQVFAFLGPNGAGKTTTVEVLEGLREATKGTVSVLGLDPWTDGRELHRQIGVIPQDFRFFEKITPREAIEYYAALFDRKADAMGLLRQVGLDDKANARFDTLSGGQKQKLGLSLALVNDPKIYFLDEPTTGLDPQARRSIWEVIKTLKAAHRTVFLTTHYLEEAELLADQVAIIHHGRIIAEGTPASIIREHGRPQRLVVEGSPGLPELLRTSLKLPVRVDAGRAVVEIRERKDIVQAMVAIEQSGLPWSGFATESDTLEDVFVSLVGRMDDGVLKSEGSA
ncbi:MAG: ABC transporter ATP-binding protein [Thermoplasmata archaeon]|nr:ABC transporter ATP-binding protein [Thermoplasmata archaeon]